MKKTIAILTLAATAAFTVFAEEAKKPAAAAAADAAKPQLTAEQKHQRTLIRQMKRFGGYLFKREPNSLKFAFIDAQKKVPAAAYTNQYPIISDVYAVELAQKSFDGKIGTENAAEVIKGCGAGAGVIFVDRPDYPALLIAPECGYGFINVAALSADKAGQALLEKRFRRELWRAFAMVAGSPNTEWPQCLLNSITSLKELDLIDSEAVSPEPATRIDKHLRKLGIKPFKKVTYRQACQEGWAPKPANEFQQKIWDEIHELPKAPLKLEK